MRAVKGFSIKRKKFDMKQDYTVKKILKGKCKTEGNSEMKGL